MELHIFSLRARHLIQCLCCFVIISILISCAAPIPLPKDNSIEKKKLVPFNVGKITLVDVRKDSLTHEMKLPPVVTKTKDRIMHPVITEKLQYELFDVIRQASYADGPSAEVTIFIRKANVKVNGGAYDLNGIVFFETLIEAHIPDVGVYWIATLGSEYRFHTTQSVRESDLVECFRITARNVVYKELDGFERMETEVGR